MSELSARLGLYRAMDDVVRDDPARLAAAAQVIPAYRSDLQGMAPAVGWYDKFVKWAGGNVPAHSELDLNGALEHLESKKPESPSDAAHRVRTLWAAGRVFSEDELPSDRLETALDKTVGEDRLDGVDEVVRTMRQPDAAPRREDLGRFHDVVTRATRPDSRAASTALDAGGLDLAGVDSNAPPPPSAPSTGAGPAGADTTGGAPGLGGAGPAGGPPSSLSGLCQPSESDFVQVQVPLVPGGWQGAGELPMATELAVRIVTPGCRIDVGEPGHLEPEDVMERIHPSRWEECYPSFWCRMERIGNPDQDVPFKYREHVGDCPDWTMFSPCLKFAYVQFEKPGNMTRLEYALCEPPDPFDPSNPRPQAILVDRGWISVRLHDEGGRQYATVETVKIVYFAPPLTGAPLAILLDAMGYGEGARTMMTTCLNKVPNEA